MFLHPMQQTPVILLDEFFRKMVCYILFSDNSRLAVLSAHVRIAQYDRFMHCTNPKRCMVGLLYEILLRFRFLNITKYIQYYLTRSQERYKQEKQTLILRLILSKYLFFRLNRFDIYTKLRYKR